MTAELVADAIRQIISESSNGPDERGLDVNLWRALDLAGYTRVGVPEHAGGSGGTSLDSHAVIVALGAGGAAVPVAETMVAGWLCASAGLELPPGIATVDLADGSQRVPWASLADHIVVARSNPRGILVRRVPANGIEVVGQDRNIAGEPRDDIVITGNGGEEALVPGVTDEIGLWWGALTRSVATVGALQRILELTCQYVCVREQFGQPLAQFQVVRHQMAEMAEEVAAASVVAWHAMVSTDSPHIIEVSATKIRTAMAATMVASRAHQLHGAIGFTDEHELHRSTLRAWAWRDEFGTQAAWELRLGQYILMRAPNADLWTTLTG